MAKKKQTKSAGSIESFGAANLSYGRITPPGVRAEEYSDEERAEIIAAVKTSPFHMTFLLNWVLEAFGAIEPTHAYKQGEVTNALNALYGFEHKVDINGTGWLVEPYLREQEEAQAAKQEAETLQAEAFGHANAFGDSLPADLLAQLGSDNLEEVRQAITEVKARKSFFAMEGQATKLLGKSGIPPILLEELEECAGKPYSITAHRRLNDVIEMIKPILLKRDRDKQEAAEAERLRLEAEAEAQAEAERLRLEEEARAAEAQKLASAQQHLQAQVDAVRRYQAQQNGRGLPVQHLVDVGEKKLSRHVSYAEIMRTAEMIRSVLEELEEEPAKG